MVKSFRHFGRAFYLPLFMYDNSHLTQLPLLLWSITCAASTSTQRFAGPFLYIFIFFFIGVVRPFHHRFLRLKDPLANKRSNPAPTIISPLLWEPELSILVRVMAGADQINSLPSMAVQTADNQQYPGDTAWPLAVPIDVRKIDWIECVCVVFMFALLFGFWRIFCELPVWSVGPLP